MDAFTTKEAQMILAATKRRCDAKNDTGFFGRKGVQDLEAMQATLAEAGFEIVRGWRPISEVTPGTWLLWDGVDQQLGHGPYADGVWRDYFSPREFFATHFRPLPEPPKDGA